MLKIYISLKEDSFLDVFILLDVWILSVLMFMIKYLS